jgi:glucokinase
MAALTDPDRNLEGGMYLGVDIGGTKVLALVLGPDGGVLARGKSRVKATDPESVLKTVWRSARKALDRVPGKKTKIRRVGLGVPSAVRGGTARFAPALGWREVEIGKLAERAFGRPVFVGNDVNLGMAAEYRLGAGRAKGTVAGFFVGTGVGGAIIHEGRLLRGKDGMAGELGHLIVVPGGRKCGCGNSGCLEAYASKTALLARIKEVLYRDHRPSLLAEDVQPDTKMIRSSVLCRAYRARDAVAREILEEGLRMLGPAVASVLNMLSPERIVLGGGVVEAFGTPLVQKIRGWAEPYVFGDRDRVRVIVPSALGDDAVALGAALLARYKGSLL